MGLSALRAPTVRPYAYIEWALQVQLVKGTSPITLRMLPETIIRKTADIRAKYLEVVMAKLQTAAETCEAKIIDHEKYALGTRGRVRWYKDEQKNLDLKDILTIADNILLKSPGKKKEQCEKFLKKAC